MGYRNTKQCVDDLAANGRLIRIADEIDPYLEMAEIHRRVFANGGPALFFENVKGCQFPMASNLFGDLERARFIFRDTIEHVRRAIELKIDPRQFFRKPTRYLNAPFTAWRMQPKYVRHGKVMANETKISQLPCQVSWPRDGGPFVTLPQVYSENVEQPGWQNSNLGMYRIQLEGNDYTPDKQIGLHYQIHRGIGVHHQIAKKLGRPFRVNIFIGGAPSMTLSAVMPLPEGMSELTFAGALAGHRIPMVKVPGETSFYGDADFVISGVVDPDREMPEGPFGDHLGYYSLVHDFPVLNVDRVYHRDNAVWPFTVVGRPPQEDTAFGELIHELTGPIIPTVLPGVKAVHAVDAAGVHPLLLAIGSERYVPYRQTSAPQELLTQANAILGQGQLSLAKYLWIIDEACDPNLQVDDIETFFERMLERVDWERDLHFQTRTTIDTLDYSGSGFNEGSKVVIAAAGEKRRELPSRVPADLDPWPLDFSKPQLCIPGVACIEGPPWRPNDLILERLKECCAGDHPINKFPLVVIVDDADFCARQVNNFLWMAFTRSNPATDIDGFGAFSENKHWGCRGSLIIDARIKPHHAPPLIEDLAVMAKVDARAARCDDLAKYL